MINQWVNNKKGEIIGEFDGCGEERESKIILDLEMIIFKFLI